MRRPWEEVRRSRDPLTEDLEHNVFLAIVPDIPGVPKTGIPVRWFETGLPDAGMLFRVTAREERVQRLVVAREKKEAVDFGLLRAWLARCRCHHGESCARSRPPGLELPGFKVINCLKEPPVIEVRPWTERYLALSYVWGPPSGDWPQTIMDAVEVTRRLGERYLWVDRTCIDQTNDVEKEFFVNKMDAIYEGAEFTIVCAAGDARSGLPGVNTVSRNPVTRTPQPRVELAQRSQKAKGKSAVRFEPGSLWEVVGLSEEDYDIDRAGEQEWLDDTRFGLRGNMSYDFGELLKDNNLKRKYDIPDAHYAWYQEMAEEDGHSIENYLEIQKELARRIGIPLRQLVPYFKREIAREKGLELDPSELDSMPIGEKPLTDSSKPVRPLPASTEENKVILVSTMQDPRTTIKGSQWATRGWTYQEGVLAHRRLVFTPEQVYWECRGMAVCETIDLALNTVHEPSGKCMADYMLSGILDDDLHKTSELQYGFERPRIGDVGDQVVTLDGHLTNYTARQLTDASDSLKAFLGVAATYTTDAGLYLLLGLPVWAGAFANDEPGLQHTFALSLSSWTHIAIPTFPGSDLHVAECSRRPRFPSWTWAGWQGRVEFCNDKESKTHRMQDTNGMVGVVRMLPGPKFTNGGTEFETAAVDPSHGDFFKALTSRDWVRGMRMLWSAEMMLHDPEERHSASLSGWTPARTIGDPNMTWHLTIKKPRVMKHFDLVPSVQDGEWGRIMGRVVKVHLSLPITEAQLIADHKSGHLVSVLVFASVIPYVYNGIARYLILRRADHGRWERIGRLNMWMTEKEMKRFSNTRDMIEVLPGIPFGQDITII